MKKQYLKFVGDYKELIPLGFEFGRYFASNYQAYKLMDEKLTTITKVFIWKAKPCDCTFLRYETDVSAIIYNYIKKEDKEHLVNGVFRKYHRFIYNKVTGLTETINYKKHIALDKTLNDEDYNKAYEKQLELYEKIVIFKNDYDLLENLISKNLFTTVEFNKELGDME